MVAQPQGAGGVLVVQSGPDAGKSFPLVRGDNTIGRDPTCQVIVTDESVSRVHANVRREEQGCIVYDMGSRTGTLVQGETLSGQQLSSGDIITMGRSELTLMQVGQPQA